MKAMIIVDIPDDFKKPYADITIYDDEPPYGVIERMEYLKPIPQKILDRYEAPQDYRDGWNECLDEILGETE